MAFHQNLYFMWFEEGNYGLSSNSVFPCGSREEAIISGGLSKGAMAFY